MDRLQEQFKLKSTIGPNNNKLETLADNTSNLRDLESKLAQIVIERDQLVKENSGLKSSLTTGDFGKKLKRSANSFHQISHVDKDVKGPVMNRASARSLAKLDNNSIHNADAKEPSLNEADIRNQEKTISDRIKGRMQIISRNRRDSPKPKKAGLESR